MGRPTKPCWNCGSNTWWLTPDGRWLCGKCHPNPNPDASSGEEGPSELPNTLPSPALEVLVLRDRVIKGNKKLKDAYEQIKQLVHGSEEWREALDQWGEANEKLSSLCKQLKLWGYETCLYLNEKGEKTVKCLEQGGIGCRVCPSKIHYWEQELMALPGPSAPRVKQPEFVPGQKEFLEKLGGSNA